MNQSTIERTDWSGVDRFAINRLRDLPALYESRKGWKKIPYSPNFESKIAEPHISKWEDSPHQLPSNFVALLERPSQFLEKFGIREIDIPTTYKSLEDWESIITTVTATSPQYGYGLSRPDLKGLLRLTNGSGRIDKETRVFECENDWFLGAGPRGCFIVKEGVVNPYGWSSQRDGSYEDHISPDEVPHVNGEPIPEEDETHQQAIRKFITVFDRYTDTDLVGYHSYDGSHTFIDSNDDIVHTTGLHHLKEMETNQGAITGEWSHEIQYNHEYPEHEGKHFAYKIETSDIDHSIGDTTDDAIGNDRYVIGYVIRWNEQEYIYSKGLNSVTLHLDYVYFEETDKYDYHDIDIRTTSKKVATFEIESNEN